MMRSAGRARRKEHKMLNQNVLIEIGAAMALYGRKFILLVEKDMTLPSNLQGLYEVRYTGTKLDYDATMKRHEFPENIDGLRTAACMRCGRLIFSAGTLRSTSEDLAGILAAS